MLMRMPVGYTIRGTIGRTQRTWKFQERPMIEIAEVTSEEAPVAVSWPAHTDLTAHGRLKYNFLGQGGEDGLQLTRWYNGRHWLRLTEGSTEQYGEAGRTPNLTVARLEEGFTEGRGYNILAMNPFSPGGGHRKMEGDPREKFVTINRSGREEALARLAAAAETLLSVDGVLHVACAQPGACLALADSDSTETNVVHVDTRGPVVDGNQYLTSHTLVFGLYEWDEIADIEIRGSRDRENTRARLEALRPTVHLPESIDPDILTVRAADTYVKRFVLDCYPRMVRLHAYFDLPNMVAKEEYLRGMLAENRNAWEAEGLPVALLDLADEAFADATVELGANLSLPKPF